MNRLGSNKQAEEVGKCLVACGLFMRFAVDKRSPAFVEHSFNTLTVFVVVVLEISF